MPSGVYVIDAKATKGRIEIRRPWSKAPQLLIAGRDHTKYLDGLDRQTQAVRNAIVTADGPPTMPVQGALCFTRANRPWLRTTQIRGHLLIYRRALTKRLRRSGPLDHTRIDQVAAAVAQALRPA